MASLSDLERSLLQYKRHQELGHLKLNYLHKLSLIFVFFLLLPFIFINIFFIKIRKNSEVFIIAYKAQEPYIRINQEFKKRNRFKFLKMNRLFIPIVPIILIKDIIKNPIFSIKHLSFLGALLLKISKYYFFIKYNHISKLIVFQEYSFYMSYLTRVMETDKGKLYNVMHGVPGETYCFFRFSKCFVWGSFYKQVYIDNGADINQFIISGSIFHYSLFKNRNNDKNKNKIDILYAMDGNVDGKDDVITLLEELSSRYKIRVKQHPRHRVDIGNKLLEIDSDIVEAITCSKIIISHYSTALIDVLVLGKNPISYLYNDVLEREYVLYLEKSLIVSNKSELLHLISKKMKYNSKIILDKQYVDITKNPIKVIIDEVF